jgi:hypothetical protein
MSSFTWSFFRGCNGCYWDLRERGYSEKQALENALFPDQELYRFGTLLLCGLHIRRRERVLQA